MSLDANHKSMVQKALTPVQFDSSEYVATTEFVQRALGSNSGSIGNVGNLVLTAAHSGKVINCYSVAQTLTLPAANSVAPGTNFTIFNSVDVTINVSGGDVIYAGTASQSSLVVKAGDCVVLSQFTNAQWLAIGGAAGLKSAASFGASLAGNGYQKLPSGMIIQWGISAATTTSASVTFPIAFPNYVAHVNTHDNNSGGAITRSTFQVNDVTKTGFVATNLGVLSMGSTTFNAVQNAGCPWIAIGY